MVSSILHLLSLPGDVIFFFVFFEFIVFLRREQACLYS